MNIYMIINDLYVDLIIFFVCSHELTELKLLNLPS